MQGIRDIKRRIKTVTNTKQITKAMEMVAAAKLRRSQDKVIQSKPYAAKMQEVVERVLGNSRDYTNPTVEGNPQGKPAFIVVTADRGLCGGYNANVLRTAQKTIDKENSFVIVVGRKARDLMKKQGYNIVAEFLDIGDEPNYHHGKKIYGTVAQLLEEGLFSEVHIIYTQFINALTQRVVTEKLLPVERKGEKMSNIYLFEPSAEEVLDNLIPKYLTGKLYQALVESKAAEHGARMTAMGSATDNASEMIEKLTLTYNRARQASITQEILEIVNGANALD
ncbi:F-type H+-transporting ATPase subunit gamma [Anaerobranca californiensis DSM 14826]|jgi:F-type H+-transporting ATPase subunit gamma|uniref:ATP synthase gamma chain n=1 Tax=Anaerobranca californiensis DSM 14826 TaxID=1120989 RepID=A0A1M6MB79_9FIRM|nr:ATP synthase F1 subunit gamma [Anaerobranca californiensis]SHJ80697.1 F-type H+-transporting ATPase subunit gamma [Anaerobranca californiensis DSM 14826]